MKEKNITNICIESKRGYRKGNKKMVKISATSFLFPVGTVLFNIHRNVHTASGMKPAAHSNLVSRLKIMILKGME
jgi:hypothetical protein